METKVFCVIIRKDDGTEFVAHDKVGAAVYFVKKEAFALSKELREHNFKARVVPAKIVLA